MAADKIEKLWPIVNLAPRFLDRAKLAPRNSSADELRQTHLKALSNPRADRKQRRDAATYFMASWMAYLGISGLVIGVIFMLLPVLIIGVPVRGTGEHAIIWTGFFFFVADGLFCTFVSFYIFLKWLRRRSS